MSDPIRVRIVGKHPWTGSSGTVARTDTGGVQTIRIFSTGPEMVKVILDGGHECFAEKKHMRLLSVKKTR